MRREGRILKQLNVVFVYFCDFRAAYSQAGEINCRKYITFYSSLYHTVLTLFLRMTSFYFTILEF